MTNHPNRGKNPDQPGRTPRPDEVIAARAALGLTQTAAAKIIHSSMRAWQEWEYGTNRMHPAMWELFRKKTRGMPLVPPKDTPPKEGPDGL